MDGIKHWERGCTPTQAASFEDYSACSWDMPNHHPLAGTKQHVNVQGADKTTDTTLYGCIRYNERKEDKQVKPRIIQDIGHNKSLFLLRKMVFACFHVINHSSWNLLTPQRHIDICQEVTCKY